MIATLDTNIAVALLIDLPYSEQARQIVSQASAAIAPDLIISEFANTLWKIALAGNKPAAEFDHILAGLPLLFDEIIAGRLLMKAALHHAVTLKHPAYDCFFVALALSRQAALVTADRSLARVIREAGLEMEVRLIEPS